MCTDCTSGRISPARGPKAAVSAGLLVDLLEHVVGILAALHRIGGQLRLVHAALHRISIDVEDRHAVAAHFGEVAFFEELEAARHRQQRLHVGGDEVLAVCEADHQRTGDARHHQPVRCLRVQHDDCVRAFETGHGAAHRLGERQVLLQKVADQMGDDLGVGLRRELVALAAQLTADRFVVFDDAVVDHRDAAAGHVRMRVGLGDAAVRRPARMGNAQVAGAGRGLQPRFQHFDLADGAPHLQGAVAAEHRDAGGIVAAVAQAPQALDENGNYIAPRRGADDAAHSWLGAGKTLF
jgi:hypothetical protein